MNLQGRDLKLDLSGDDVRLLHTELAQIGQAVPDEEVQRAFFGKGTREAVARFQKQHGLETTGVVEAATARAINNEVAANTYSVSGKVASPDRAGVGGLIVQIVDKNAGPDTALADTATNDDGEYSITFPASAFHKQRKVRPDLQARVYAGKTFLGASEVRYNAGNQEELHVLLPANSEALASEYQTLTNSLAPHVAGALRDLKETDDRQDITYLANKTGWDARAVALAALADQFSQYRVGGAAGAGLQPEFYYALFRAGLPANPEALYQADAKTVAQTWKNAIQQGVIPKALEAQIPNAAKTYQALAAAQALDSHALNGASSLKEMLRVSLGDNAQDHQKFADIYTRYRGDSAKLWDAVNKTFGEKVTARLQLDGQLAYMTLNNAAVISRLHDAQGRKPLASTVDLAQRGYYQAKSWLPIVEGVVPDSIPGANPEEKRANYADVLATQVRISFPTAVAAEMVSNDEIPLHVAPALRDGVSAFLMTHQGKFEIGMQPIEQYIARNKLGNQTAPEVTQQVKRLQRVYQITPNDQAMAGLLRNDLDSAYRVAQYSQAEFVASFKDQLGGEQIARLVHTKAQQVHVAVLSIATNYLTMRRAPALGASTDALVMNPKPKGQAQAANGADVIAYPTLEQLFGSMDFCACDHCRSILSPAAYLVDLLQFIDRTPATLENPQAVLLQKRPDLQYLPLTCENTNTPLPYIDVVNETLEYFVTNNLSLNNYAGHNTDGTASAEELLATPQFVSQAAYNTLKGEFFPPPLPFHRDLELLRRHFDQFEVPLPKAMEAVRASEAIDRPNPASYGWRDILMEQIKLNRTEYQLLTDSALTIQQIYGYPPATTTANVLAELSNVKKFTRRMGLKYDDIIEILKTRFVNPNSILIPKLEKLGVPFSTLKALKDGTISDNDFDALLPAGLDPAQYNGDVKAWIKDNANYARIMGLITISNPTDSNDLCASDALQFRYANPDNNANSLRAIDFLRMLRFLRLWKKLKWTVPQVDATISALYPSAQLPDGANEAVDLTRLDNGFAVLVPRLGEALQVVAELKLNAKKDLPGLLACWSTIHTHGIASLYWKMFLSASLQTQDPAFADDGYGNVLKNAGKLLPHAETLRSAFAITDDEFSRIVAALTDAPAGSHMVADLPAGQPFVADPDLTLENISAIYRRGWLARKLRLSVRELLLLIEFAGFNPFIAPDPANPPVMRLLQLVKAMRVVSLKPAQALYLMWNQDISGKSVPKNEQVTRFARVLRAGFTDIENQFSLVADPTGEVAGARMALVYGQDATDFFFGLLNNTFSVDVTYNHSQAALEQAILDAAPNRIGYDDLRKRLSYAGVLTVAVRNNLQNVAGVSAAFQTAVGNLYNASQAAITPFFTRYPELVALFTAYDASADPPEKKRSALLANFLPQLKAKRKRQQALTVITAEARTDSLLASAILDDAAVLHAFGNNASAAVEDLLALERPGLAASFFWSDTVPANTNPDLAVDTAALLDYSAAGTNKLPANPAAGQAISGIWSGDLEAPEDGFYNFAVEADAGATVTLSIDGEDVPLAHNANVWSNQAAVSLTAGVLHAIELKVEKVTNTLAVRWESLGHGWEILPSEYLYSGTLVDHLRTAYIRFFKMASLASVLKITPNEFSELATAADYQVAAQGWLNLLPASGDPDVATSAALLKILVGLLDYARIKAALAPDDERLLSAVQDPAAVLDNGDSLLFSVTGWDSDSLDALLARFGKVRADLSSWEVFRRVYDAYAVVKILQIPAPALIAAATNDPNGDVVRNLQSALRARYEQAAWLDVIKPINDDVRGLQRDALVVYVLRKLAENPATEQVDTPDKLFEYFLMDVQMEPCMQTSRIRHALSSVQLFIERCLMNLEKRVSPQSILANQWEWMKRYRVWEANRKVFLWPENWLEPELRDDQSPIFKETMSELLQSDITEDTAATALLNYLSKVEEIAKLEPCGIHYVEGDPGTQDDVAHVIARTSGAKRKYYYRRLQYPNWSPWEQIKVNIEDNPILPVVWGNRLLLFWLRMLKQGPDSSARPSGGKLSELSVSNLPQDPQVKVQAVLCWSEYYNGKWQAEKTSDVNFPTGLDSATVNAFNRSELYLQAALENQSAGEAPALRIGVFNLANQNLGKASFLFYNTHSLPVRAEDKTAVALPLLSKRKHRLDSDYSLVFEYYDGSQPKLTRQVLYGNIPYSYMKPWFYPFRNAWPSPFFFEDSRHVFWVTCGQSVKPQLPGYGITHTLPYAVDELPPLVMRRDPRLEFVPEKNNPILKGPNFGVVDPSPIRKLVTEDVNIHTGIGTTSAVRYGDKDFGPAGALSQEFNAEL